MDEFVGEASKAKGRSKVDWIALLEDNGISYVTKGPNTKKGEISCQCPWCGGDDPSQHLGISLTTENWGCHRNPEHRGKSVPRLIAGLLGCSYPQALLVAAQYSRPDASTLDDALALLTGASGYAKPGKGHKVPTLPPEFRPVTPKGTSLRFWRYLQHRRFDDVGTLVSDYSLLCCATGRWKDRIIIPLTQGGKLIGWTGRALQNPVNAPRYLSSSDAIKRTVFNEDILKTGGKILFVTEGPFDALKIDFYGKRSGARATCLFGLSISVDQVVIIRKLSKCFDRTIILFDDKTVEQSFHVGDWMCIKGLTIGRLPPGVKDPGELSGAAVADLVKECL